MWKGGKIAMIENANDKPQSLLKAESDLEKAKHRLEEEKKKANEKKRKADNHNKIVWGGISICWSTLPDRCNIWNAEWDNH